MRYRPFVAYGWSCKQVLERYLEIEIGEQDQSLFTIADDLDGKYTNGTHAPLPGPGALIGS